MAKYMPEKRFSFTSSAASLNEETFGVVQFTGVEGISLPYEFDIMLVSDNPDIDLDEIMAVPAKFTIHRTDGGDVDFHGILDSFEQLHKYDEYIFYRARLVPRLWWLSITHHNQVCLQKTVPQIIELALKDSGLSTLDFEFKLRGDYPSVEYVCQYNESHFNFISRWLEREGMYYYFDQKGPFEKIIVTDTYIAHTDLPDVHYAPPAGLLEAERTEVVNSFICRQRQLPRKIHLKDYNYERPSLGISGSADVDAQGRGTDYIYGEYFPTSEEGNRLAALRAETLNCRKREFIGESTVPFLEPGYTFTLHNHYRESFNGKYLVESVSHEGNQVGYLLPEISEGLAGYKNTVYYRNSFTAIPAHIQFRSERKAIKPHISGALHAVIDAEGSGQYAELDNQGRYRVRLPFDESDDHKAGKASTYLRMMQPYANRSGGMQFPLTKGTEVLLTFIDGDPDRPVIAGAVANPETPSPVNAKNQTESVIQTGGNNKIRIEDKKGKERIIMESPTASSWVRIGAPNDPVQEPNDPVQGLESSAGIKISTTDEIELEAGQGRDLTKNSEPDEEYNSINSDDDQMRWFGRQAIDEGLMDAYGVIPNNNEYLPNLDTQYSHQGKTDFWTPSPVNMARIKNTVSEKNSAPRYYSYWDDKLSKRQRYDMNSTPSSWKYSPVIRRKEKVSGSYKENIEGDMLTVVEGAWDCTIKGHLYNTTYGNVHSDYYQNNSEYYYGDVLDVYGQPSTDGTGDVSVTEVAYGPKYEWHFGDKVEALKGTLYEYHEGGKESMIKSSDGKVILHETFSDVRDVTVEYGDPSDNVTVVETFWGSKQSRCMGAESCMTLGNKNDFYLGPLKDDTMVGISINTFLGGVMNTNFIYQMNSNLGIQMDSLVGGKIEYNNAFLMQNKALELKKEGLTFRNCLGAFFSFGKMKFEA
ncbi:MAG: type VI secretion system tip protein VgrG [Chitinispirillaceae bacterium]|nr:type VI secretion system tip protein VgrG [Chitinispirillaceae bacterium]